ncbi:MAG: hypothetical protein GY804_09915 [Alphaproteobacteria bacterium]|nr:hypothetical protein [Alphaproteobacteria bacterium]
MNKRQRKKLLKKIKALNDLSLLAKVAVKAINEFGLSLKEAAKGFQKIASIMQKDKKFIPGSKSHKG